MTSWSSMAMASSLFRKLVTLFIACDATQAPRLQAAIIPLAPATPYLQLLRLLRCLISRLKMALACRQHAHHLAWSLNDE